MSSVQPPAADVSLGELFSDLTTDMSALLRDELSLAKVELKEEITKVGRAGGMFGGAALAGYMTIVGSRRGHGGRLGLSHRRGHLGSRRWPAVPAGA